MQLIYIWSQLLHPLIDYVLYLFIEGQPIVLLIWLGLTYPDVKICKSATFLDTKVSQQFARALESWAG